ncbi:MAG TPA: DUF1566 domain-containing protein [Candidatus Binatia bacterium]
MQRGLQAGIALAILMTANSAFATLAAVCGDVNETGTITSSDALLVLKKGVGQNVSLSCAGYDEEVAACQSNLTTCNEDLSATNADLSSCNENLSAANAALSSCNEDLSAANADLSSTNADLQTCLSHPVCGNGLVESGEECDVQNLNGHTCASLGFAGGTLACSTGCAIDESGCYETRFDTSGVTTIDHQSGLEWEQKDGSDGSVNAVDPHDVDNKYTWTASDTPPSGTAFTDFLAALNGASTGSCYAGHCDWRLPTPDEFATILLSDCPDGPCVVDSALLPMRDGFYWTAATDSVEHTGAIDADLSSGFVGLGSDKTSNFFVRAVRSR